MVVKFVFNGSNSLQPYDTEAKNYYHSDAVFYYTKTNGSKVFEPIFRMEAKFWYHSYAAPAMKF